MDVMPKREDRLRLCYNIFLKLDGSALVYHVALEEQKGD